MPHECNAGIAWTGIAWTGIAWTGIARTGTARTGTARTGIVRSRFGVLQQEPLRIVAERKLGKRVQRITNKVMQTMRGLQSTKA